MTNTYKKQLNNPNSSTITKTDFQEIIREWYEHTDLMLWHLDEILFECGGNGLGFSDGTMSHVFTEKQQQLSKQLDQLFENIEQWYAQKPDTWKTIPGSVYSSGESSLDHRQQMARGEYVHERWSVAKSQQGSLKQER